MRRIILGAVLTLLPATSHSQALSAAERRMVASVDAGQAGAVALLERLVNINSGTHNFAGVKAVADALAPEFQKLGFTTRWSEGGRIGIEFEGPLPPEAGTGISAIRAVAPDLLTRRLTRRTG